MDLVKNTVFTAIDFESAGTASGKTDAPIQIATCQWSLDQGYHELWTSYIFTDQSITWSAQKVHGITKGDLRNAPILSSLWPQIQGALANKVVVAHGHGTEKRFLRAFPYHGFGPWLDTITLSKKAYPDLESYALGDICESLNLTKKVKALVAEKSWHDALFDSVASLVILENIINEFDLTEKYIEDIL
ncbi:exonuclease domain-containing protein [Akkermansiaceae bacterium]|nr:exonuclease domain-containing protein [Akkermansiaceae bacterium]